MAYASLMFWRGSDKRIDIKLLLNITKDLIPNFLSIYPLTCLHNYLAITTYLIVAHFRTHFPDITSLIFLLGYHLSTRVSTSITMSNCYRPVIVQANNSYPSTSSSASSYTQSNSSSSSRSYISTTNSSPTHTLSSMAPSRSATRPAQTTEENGNIQREFVHTGRPQGGNPNGGPTQHPEGYTRVSKGNVTIHNSGGQLKGNVSVDLGPRYANGPEHSGECIERSRWSDNQGLCFCPPRRN